jgi:hypothetical protein
MLARAVRLRLLPEGTLFQVFMTFIITSLAGGTTLALRAIFERNSPSAHGRARLFRASCPCGGHGAPGSVPVHHRPAHRCLARRRTAEEAVL